MELNTKLLEEHKEKVFVFTYHAWLWTFSVGPMLFVLIILMIGTNMAIDASFRIAELIGLVLFSVIPGILLGLPFFLFFRFMASLSFLANLSPVSRFWFLFITGLGALLADLVLFFVFLGASIESFASLVFLVGGLSFSLVFSLFCRARRSIFFDYSDLDDESSMDDVLDVPLQ